MIDQLKQELKIKNADIQELNKYIMVLESQVARLEDNLATQIQINNELHGKLEVLYSGALGEIGALFSEDALPNLLKEVISNAMIQKLNTKIKNQKAAIAGLHAKLEQKVATNDKLKCGQELGFC